MSIQHVISKFKCILILIALLLIINLGYSGKEEKQQKQKQKVPTHKVIEKNNIYLTQESESDLIDVIKQRSNKARQDKKNQIQKEKKKLRAAIKPIQNYTEIDEIDNLEDMKSIASDVSLQNDDLICNLIPSDSNQNNSYKKYFVKKYGKDTTIYSMNNEQYQQHCAYLLEQENDDLDFIDNDDQNEDKQSNSSVDQMTMLLMQSKNPQDKKATFSKVFGTKDTNKEQYKNYKEKIELKLSRAAIPEQAKANDFLYLKFNKMLEELALNADINDEILEQTCTEMLPLVTKKWKTTPAHYNKVYQTTEKQSPNVLSTFFHDHFKLLSNVLVDISLLSNEINVEQPLPEWNKVSEKYKFNKSYKPDLYLQNIGLIIDYKNYSRFKNLGDLDAGTRDIIQKGWMDLNDQVKGFCLINGNTNSCLCSHTKKEDKDKNQVWNLMKIKGKENQ